MQELKFSVLETKVFLGTWISEQKAHEDKERLLDFRKSDYPALKSSISELSNHWEPVQKDTLFKLFEVIDLLFETQNNDVIYSLQGFDDYQDAFAVLYARTSVEEGGEIYILTKQIIAGLNHLIALQKENAKEYNEDMFASFDSLQFLTRNLGIALIIIGILIAWYTTRTIVSPIKKLKAIAVKLGRGVFPKGRMREGQDEIGEMTAAMNNVVDGFKAN